MLFIVHVIQYVLLIFDLACTTFISRSSYCFNKIFFLSSCFTFVVSQIHYTFNYLLNE